MLWQTRLRELPPERKHSAGRWTCEEVAMHTYRAHITWDRQRAMFRWRTVQRGTRMVVRRRRDGARLGVPQSCSGAVLRRRSRRPGGGARGRRVELSHAGVPVSRGPAPSDRRQLCGRREWRNGGERGRSAVVQPDHAPSADSVADEASPSAEEVAALHHAAHDGCYVANSLKCDVVVEPVAAEV
jgi:hypothetical protein